MPEKKDTPSEIEFCATISGVRRELDEEWTLRRRSTAIRIASGFVDENNGTMERDDGGQDEESDAISDRADPSILAR